MNNKEIINSFRKALALSELYGEDSKGFYSAIFNLERINTELIDKEPSEMQSLGLTRSQAKAVYDLIQTGTFAELKAYTDKTPIGVMDILNIKGLGGKKVGVLWRELGIDSISALQAACESGTVAKTKGFGQKTQEAILQQIVFLLASSDKKHLDEAEKIAVDILSQVKEQYPNAMVVGHVRQCHEVVEKLDFLLEADTKAHDFLSKIRGAVYQIDKSGPYSWRGKINSFDTVFHLRKKERFVAESFVLSSSPDHLKKNNLGRIAASNSFETEEQIYQKAGLPYFPPELREGLHEFEFADKFGMDNLVEYSRLKGILHNHSTYSDGKHSLKEMAEACRDLGFEYLGITDHSRSAFYAGGLNEAAIQRQHEEIDKLNQELSPFKILKGIESDILSDGSLDYEPHTLATFDFVIASVHSHLNMSQEKATARLVAAIENPYTSILGHPTGRLLLRREGYPIDHKMVIEACARCGVAIEINSHPWRLDLDWRWVHEAVCKGVVIAICPDAHEKNGYQYMKLGTKIARKGGLPQSHTLNALSLREIEHFFARQRHLKQ